MKTWCIIDTTNTDEFLKVFDTKEDAIAEAESAWNALTDYDKNRRTSYLVGLCNIEDGQFAEDELGNIDADIYEVAVQFK